MKVWTLETAVFRKDRTTRNTMLFTSKKKAIQHAEITVIYTLDSDLKDISTDKNRVLLLARATYFKDNLSVEVTIYDTEVY